MRIRKIKATTGTVESYNDSNVEWVVTFSPLTEDDFQFRQTFPMNKWTQKDAMDFYMELNRIEKI